MKTKLVKALAISTTIVATLVASSASFFIFHQPKQPNTLA
jgi:cyclic lactone autoinducer peptide